MAEHSGIAWTHHTFNHLWGCTEEGPECDFCYAREFAHRMGVGWGNESRRKFFGDKHWLEPIRWNARARKNRVRERVFVASMADVGELLPPTHPDFAAMDEARARLWNLIEQTESLDYLLLSKRPQNYVRVFPEAWKEQLPRNVWLGATAGTQEHANRRLGQLRKASEALLPIVTFASLEPLLGPIRLEEALPGFRLSWAIIGGESDGRGRARPFEATWAQALLQECDRTGVAPFFKQFGSNPTENGTRLHFQHRKGEDPSEWPTWAQDARLFPAAL